MESLTANNLILKNLNECLDDVGDYVYNLHIPSLNQGWIGAKCSQVITYSSGGLLIWDGKGTQKIEAKSTDLWKHLRELLKPESTYFFLVSLDLERSTQDPDLPLAIFVKPDVEISLRGGELPDLRVVASEQLNQKEIQSKIEALLAKHDLSKTQTIPYFPQDRLSMTDWQGESDRSFLSRVTEGIKILQNQVEERSKMVICRSYHQAFSDEIKPLDLYELYTLMEPNCAASHYFQMPDGVISYGCSPENIFELTDRDISMDVIASTRKRVVDMDEDSKLEEAFLDDFKEDKEHKMARDRTFQILADLCVPNTVKLTQDKNTRKLRHVSHLFSEYSGKLKNSLEYLDLLEKYFPPLTSYPPSLVPLADNRKEPTRFYGGMVGRISTNAIKEVHCFNNLRSGLMKQNTMHIRAGVGVIKYSNPESELREVSNKLRCLLEALTMWKVVT